MHRFALEGDKQRGVGRQAEFGEVLILEVKCDGFPEVGDHFVKGLALRNNRDFYALGHIVGLTMSHHCLDRMLELHPLFSCYG